MQLKLKKAKNFGFLKEDANYLRFVEELDGEEECKDTKEFRLESGYYNPNKLYGNSHTRRGERRGVKQVTITPAVRADLSGLIKEVFNIRTALSNIAYTAKRLPKEYDVKAKKSMFLVGDGFNNLVSKETLLKIASACESMSARCMKSYRKTKAPCCKRYYSTFRALEQQAERLEQRLKCGITGKDDEE